MPQKDTRTHPEWISFCKRPFESEGGYFSYVNELAIITADYSTYMERNNSSGVSLRQIIRNGASRQHFEGLQNGSRLLERLGPKGAQLGVGTTRNEQLHRELKSWMRNIYQTHEDRLQTGLRVFLFAKLLTHSSAAYSPTLKQCSQQRLLSIIAGKLRSAQFFSQSPVLPTNTLSMALTRNDLQATPVDEDPTFSETRSRERVRNSLKWKKLDKKNKKPHGSATNIFKRRRKY